MVQVVGISMLVSEALHDGAESHSVRHNLVHEESLCRRQSHCSQIPSSAYSGPKSDNWRDYCFVGKLGTDVPCDLRYLSDWPNLNRTKCNTIG